MAITALFLDLGGVLLTNGWDRNARELAAKTFRPRPQGNGRAASPDL